MPEPSTHGKPADGYRARRLQPDDAPAVVDCVLDVYGRQYPKPALYDSHLLAELIAKKRWVGAVIEIDNTIVAYSALDVSLTGPIAEFGMAMVRKAHRRKGLLERLRDYLKDVAADMGLHGRYVEIGMWDVTLQKLADRSPPPQALRRNAWLMAEH